MTDQPMTPQTSGRAASARGRAIEVSPRRSDRRAGAPRARVVIIGGGFGGVAAARALERAPVEVTLLDRTNHFLFQPLLYQVATAALSPSDISVPHRVLLRGQRNLTVLMADAEEIDVGKKCVVLGGRLKRIPFDFLILATGARHSYFGHDEWEALAPGLKNVEDALGIRNRFLCAFEEAEKTDDPLEREILQTFVVVGAGPTGVELAGALPLIVRRAIRQDFRRTDTALSRVVLLEAGPRVLPTFPESLSRRAQRDLEALGVEVRTDAMVTRVEPSAVWIGSERIATRTVFWAAGNEAAPIARSLGVPLERDGRVRVEPDLTVPGHPHIYAIGDVAAVEHEGSDVPGVAPAARQEGKWAAHNIERELRGEPRAPFRYREKGYLATIGRSRAVADFGRVRLAGRLAWWLWLVVHILFLAGFRNRILVLTQWAYAYFTYERGVRLITNLPAAVRAAAASRIGPSEAPAAEKQEGRQQHAE